MADEAKTPNILNEKTRVPLNIATLIMLIASVATFVYSLSEMKNSIYSEINEIKHEVSVNTDSIERIEEEQRNLADVIEVMEASNIEFQISAEAYFADISANIKWIIQLMEDR